MCIADSEFTAFCANGSARSDRLELLRATGSSSNLPGLRYPGLLCPNPDILCNTFQVYFVYEVPFGVLTVLASIIHDIAIRTSLDL